MNGQILVWPFVFTFSIFIIISSLLSKFTLGTILGSIILFIALFKKFKNRKKTVDLMATSPIKEEEVPNENKVVEEDTTKLDAEKFSEIISELPAKYKLLTFTMEELKNISEEEWKAKLDFLQNEKGEEITNSFEKEGSLIYHFSDKYWLTDVIFISEQKNVEKPIITHQIIVWSKTKIQYDPKLWLKLIEEYSEGEINFGEITKKEEL